MKFSIFQVSRKGGREMNEDRMGYCYTSHAGLFAVADGMGGHPEGELRPVGPGGCCGYRECGLPQIPSVRARR